MSDEEVGVEADGLGGEEQAQRPGPATDVEQPPEAAEVECGDQNVGDRAATRDVSVTRSDEVKAIASNGSFGEPVIEELGWMMGYTTEAWVAQLTPTATTRRCRPTGAAGCSMAWLRPSAAKGLL